MTTRTCIGNLCVAPLLNNLAPDASGLLIGNSTAGTNSSWNRNNNLWTNASRLVCHKVETMLKNLSVGTLAVTAATQIDFAADRRLRDASELRATRAGAWRTEE